MEEKGIDHQTRSMLAIVLGAAVGYILSKVTYQVLLLEVLPQHLEPYQNLFPILGSIAGAIAMPIIVYVARGEVKVVGTGLALATASAICFVTYALFVPERVVLLIAIWLGAVLIVRFFYMMLKPRGKGLKS
ncbi:MAG: hypothetical protein OXC81_05590 [Betaproteobacteria bacterium]|nr:hypothetical protein [Betaproteobacteria bacterium]